MAEYKILVKYKIGFFDAEGERIKKDILNYRIKKSISVETAQVYEISGSITFKEIKKIAISLLSDPVSQLFFVNFNLGKTKAIEVYYKKGVTDSVAETVKLGIIDMGVKKNLSVRTGKKYFIDGNLLQNELKKIAEKILANNVVQDYKIE
ncbi:MAG: phosphoribosylformylglycinamidine synthase subunit PurS [Elusimicrobia bacterium]|nr:phosphoribosylformylglycinamidine synthase subunit PurS [Elusimicrobiota bacterium]